MAPSATTDGTYLSNDNTNGHTKTDNINNGSSNNKKNRFQRSNKKDPSQEAYEIIQQKLPSFHPIDAVLELDIGLCQGAIWIDMRSQPCRILESFDGEADCSVKIKPLYVKSFYEGAMDPRYGFFKDAFFDEMSLPKGKISVAVKFADMLTPNPPTEPVHIDNLDTTQLPKPTEDLDQVRQDIKKWGYGLVANALSPRKIEIMRSALLQQAAGETAAGVAKNDGGPTAPNQRIWTLINKGQEFVDFLEHPLINAMIPDMLGENFLVHSYTANIARQGNVPQGLHTDQVGIQPPIRSMYYGVNIMWFLTDINAENGGTRVFPGSHLGNIAPSDPFSIDGSVAAEGPAGTALVFESRLWHATGPNSVKGVERPVVLMFFMRSFIRQQENNFLSIRPDVEAGLSDRVRKMLGFMTDGAFGGVEGEVREGNFVRRVENPVGPFRDTHRHSRYRAGLDGYDAAAPAGSGLTLSSLYVGGGG